MTHQNEEAFSYRTQLPAPMVPQKDVSIWKILKNCIGQDLSKIAMPVILNEPLSFLQRLCEYMEYSQLLTQASQQNSASDRMKYVAAFAVSSLASNWNRLGKPFNPLLGETFELERDNYRVICEQVSHHPPVSAFHAESSDFKFHGSINPKLKFWGKSVEIQPKGTLTIEFPKWKETYTWTNVNCCVHNVIVGKLWIEQYGSLEIINQTHGHRATLNFKSVASSPKNLHCVEGFVQDENKKNVYFLYGKWTDFIKCCPIDAYDQHMKSNQRKNDDKIFSNTPDATPKKVLSKLQSFKMNSFRSLSIQDNDSGLPPEFDGDIPRSSSTYSLDLPDSVFLWQCEPRPVNSAEYYQFTTFAMQLNELRPDMKPPKTLCPTDSRLRPDISFLENGNIEDASKEKTRLEEKQRYIRKQSNPKSEDTWKPKWFIKIENPYTKKDDWIYNGGYWDRNYEAVTRLF